MNLLYKIGKWQFDSRDHSLTNGQTQQILTPQISELLAFFAENPNQVFSRDELIEQACQGIVSDAAINQAIARLRKYLSHQDEDSINYIETVAKKGYRFTAKVENLKQKQQVEKISQTTRSIWIAVGAFAALILVSIIYFTLSSQPSTSIVERLNYQLSPLTTDAGLEVSPTFHPLNNQVFYSHRQESQPQFDIFSRDLEFGTIEQWTNTQQEVELHPSWSDNGLHLAYVSHSASGCQIKLLRNAKPDFHSKPESIATCSPFDVQINWHPDNQRILFNRRAYKAGPLRVYSANIETGQIEELTQANKGITGDVAFALSPGGNQLAIVRTHHWNQSALWIKNLTNGEIKSVAQFPYWIRSVSWSHDSGGIVFAPAPFYRKLVRYDLASDQIQVLLERDSLIEDVQRHPRGRGYVLSERQYNYDILLRTNPQANTEENQITKDIVNSTRQDWHPSLSSSQQLLAFMSDRSGHIEIWLKDLTKNIEYQLTHFEGRTRPSRMFWSPQNDFIITDTTDNKLYSVAVDSKTVNELDQINHPARNPRWTNQGIYFSQLIKDEWQLSLLSSLESIPKSLNIAGGFSGEALNEKLVYTKFYQSGFWLSVGDEPAKQLMTSASQGPFNQWQQTSNGLYYLGTGSRGRLTVHYFDFESGLSKELFDYQSRDLSGFSVTSDESQIFFTKVKNQNADIMLATKSL